MPRAGARTEPTSPAAPVLAPLLQERCPGARPASALAGLKTGVRPELPGPPTALSLGSFMIVWTLLLF